MHSSIRGSDKKIPTQIAQWQEQVLRELTNITIGAAREAPARILAMLEHEPPWDALEANMKAISRRNAVRLLLLLTTIGMSTYSLGGYLAKGFGQQELIDWDKVKSTYTEYLKNPTPDNGKRLLEALPQEKTEDEQGDISRAVAYIDNDYIAFEGRILAGDRFLIEAAFRLLNFSDAGFSESLDQMLGNLARERPKLYLEFLLKYRNGSFIRNVGLPILETNSWEPEDMIAEWTKRVNALKTVKETKYRQIRDECIRQLDGAINQCLSENTWELIDWDKVRSTYMDYMKSPTSENGERLLEALPREKIENQKGDSSGAVAYIHNDYIAFEERVLTGDIILIEAAFRLLNFLDGAFAKEVSETLGDLATRNPWLFLDYLYRYRNSRYVKKAGPPVFGTRHKDKAEDILEWKKRIKALSAVEETRYRQIRDDCIRLLEEAIKKYRDGSMT